jgi:predicted transcriptional regulator
MANSPKGIQCSDLLNAVALDDALLKKLIDQMCSDGWIDGRTGSNQRLYITPRGAAEYYNLRQIRNREELDGKLNRRAFYVSLAAIFISVCALIAQIIAAAH